MEGESLAARFATKGAQWWARHADAPFRFASIAFEARRAGFKTAPQFRTFLSKLEDPQGLSPAERARVEYVAKEANRAGIAYDRLNGFEKSFLTRGVWFYPWVKGSVLFTGRTFLEHPFKGAALGAEGALGRKEQLDLLGALPSYEYGLIGLGGNLVTDFSTFSPFATTAEILDIASGRQRGFDLLNPAASAAGELLTKENQYGESTKHPLSDVLSSLDAATPEAQVLRDYLNPEAAGKATHMFPHTYWDTALRSLVGPATPRRINVGAANSAAAREAGTTATSGGNIFDK